MVANLPGIPRGFSEYQLPRRIDDVIRASFASPESGNFRVVLQLLEQLPISFVRSTRYGSRFPLPLWGNGIPDTCGVGRDMSSRIEHTPV